VITVDWTVFADMPTDLLDAVGIILPYVLILFTGLAGIGIAYRLFRKSGAKPV
jgi:hypothetical protein